MPSFVNSAETARVFRGDRLVAVKPKARHPAISSQGERKILTISATSFELRLKGREREGGRERKVEDVLTTTYYVVFSKPRPDQCCIYDEEAINCLYLMHCCSENVTVRSPATIVLISWYVPNTKQDGGGDLRLIRALLCCSACIAPRRLFSSAASRLPPQVPPLREDPLYQTFDHLMQDFYTQQELESATKVGKSCTPWQDACRCR